MSTQRSPPGAPEVRNRSPSLLFPATCSGPDPEDPGAVCRPALGSRVPGALSPPKPCAVLQWGQGTVVLKRRRPTGRSGHCGVEGLWEAQVTAVSTTLPRGRLRHGEDDLSPTSCVTLGNSPPPPLGASLFSEVGWEGVGLGAEGTGLGRRWKQLRGDCSLCCSEGSPRAAAPPPPLRSSQAEAAGHVPTGDREPWR